SPGAHGEQERADMAQPYTADQSAVTSALAAIRRLRFIDASLYSETSAVESAVVASPGAHGEHERAHMAQPDTAEPDTERPLWGWSWIANAYAGRSVVPMAAYTLALLIGVSLIGPTDAFFFPQSGSAQLGVNQLLAGLFQGILFVGFVAIVAAPIYWVLRSRVG